MGQKPEMVGKVAMVGKIGTDCKAGGQIGMVSSVMYIGVRTECDYYNTVSKNTTAF